MTRIALAFGTLAFLAAAPLHAREVAGVNVPETMSAGGKELKLNGAGIRKKFVVKVYVGALYLEKTTTSPDEVLAGDQVRVVHMHFLHDVGKDKIIGAYEEGFEKNSKGDMDKLKAALAKMKAGLGDMKNGQTMTVSYVPGKGVTISQQGGATVSIDENAKVVADALLRNWVGGSPADGGLKSAMLGGK